MVQMKKAQVRLDADNTKRVEAIKRAINRSPTLKTTLPTLVNYMLSTYGIPKFVESDFYKDALK